jgi:hypothetical protein
MVMNDYLDQALHDSGIIELRHHAGSTWTSGLFNDLGPLRTAIRERAGIGNLYTSLNAPHPLAATNQMGGRALRDAEVATHTRLPFDFDPVRPVGTSSSDSEQAAAVQRRDRLVSALSSLNWPRPATAVSGNGAHALYRMRLAASAELSEQLTTIYRGLAVDFGGADVTFDTTVRNPARIWRLYGSINRKGESTPERPHRRADIQIPSRWHAVSPRLMDQLANRYARQLAAPAVTNGITTVPRAPLHGAGHGDLCSLSAVSWFLAHQHYRRPLGGSLHAVRCPWAHEHSSVDVESSTSTVIWEAHGQCWPNFRCMHAHCEGRGIRDLVAYWGDADAHCSRTWRASP